MEDHEDLIKLREEIRVLRKAIHNQYAAKWKRMKEHLVMPVRYDSIPKKKIVISPKTNILTCTTHEIETNMKIHELFGSHAEWLSEDEVIIYINVVSASHEIEKYSMRLKRTDDDLWNVIKCYFPIYVSSYDIFEESSVDLTLDEVRTITKNIRDSCFSYQHRRSQFEDLKAEYHDCTISISASFCYRYVDVQLRMIHSKENKAVLVYLKILFHSNGRRPYDYIIKSEDLSRAEKTQLKTQLKPLLKYDLCYGLQISMLKREESIFILEGPKSNIESGSSVFIQSLRDDSKQIFNKTQESE